MGLFFGKKKTTAPARAVARLSPYDFEAKTWKVHEKALIKICERNKGFQLSDEDFIARYKPGIKVFQYVFTDRPAQLVPEPTNKADPNAVQVIVEGQQIGYVPKEELPIVWQYLRRYSSASVVIYGGPWKQNVDGLVEVGKNKFAIDVEVREVPVCPKCGSVVSGNFCGRCGAKLG